MKKFTFRLETVLERRTAEEAELQRALADCVRELETQRSEVARLVEAQCECRKKLEAVSGCLVDQTERRHLFMYLTQLRDSEVMKHKAVCDAEVAVEEARKQLMAASQSRQVVEKLKEKQKKEHSTKLASLEQKNLDDVSITRHARKSR